MGDNLKQSSNTVVEDCLGIDSDESVLVLCNDETYEVGESIYNSAKDVTDETYFINYPTGSNHGEEPPEFVFDIMRGFDVFVAPTQKSITHTDARRQATDNGARGATLPGIETENFIVGMSTDYNRVKERCELLYSKLHSAEELRVTTPAGTDISFEIQKDWHQDTGIARNPSDFTNLPAGEVYTTPETAEGVVYIDGTVRPHGVVSEDIRVDVTDGRATEIHDSQLKSQFEDLEDEYGDDVYNIAEIAFGTNDGVETLTGSVLLDEKCLGTAHFAIGDDSSMGGDVSVPIHEDAILRNPTVYVDGKEIKIPE